MRFMALVIHDDYGKAAPGTLPDEAAMAAMGKFNEDLVNAGVLLTAEGLHPPSMGARITYTKGRREPELVDGPYSEAREVVGGFWILDVKNKEEAIAWMRRVPFHEDKVVVELRQIQEISDFAESPAIEQERKVAERLKAQGAAKK
jgi:hypothetical protein